MTSEAESSANITRFDRQQLLDILPHGPEFMFLQRAEIIGVGNAIGTFADIRSEEFGYLKAHFPKPYREIVPAVITTEALAQLSGIATISHPKMPPKTFVKFRKIERMDFLNELSVPDEMNDIFSVDLISMIARLKMNMIWADVRASQNGIVIAQGTIILAVADTL
jgi:3-hydroxymyristoyl/3-hydroxydecanoyl-(acyl carrier protein) dehydratase